MLTAVLLTSDSVLADAVREIAGRCRQVRLERIVNRTIQIYEAVRLLNTIDPDVVFIDYADPEFAAELANSLINGGSRAARIGVRSRGQETPSGADDVIAWVDWPSDQVQFEAVATGAVRQGSERCRRQFFSFLPAKAGCGASTVALHIADALANELGHRTLLLDADLRSGVVSMYLNLDLQKTLRDALGQAADLQPVEWRGLVVSKEKLDVLGNRPEQRGRLPEWTDYYKLLQFAVPRYEAIVVDLPELTNEATAEVVRQSRRVLVVTTAEMPALKFSSLRIQELKAAGAEDGQLAVIVNRWHRRDLPLEEVERILGWPVLAAFPNDYHSVQKAMLVGGFVNPESLLGKSYLEFASRLWEKRESEPLNIPGRHRLREFFGT